MKKAFWAGLVAVSLFGAGARVEYELDAYYSNVGLYYGFNDEQIPDLGPIGEVELYQSLFAHVLSPHFVVLEASVNPMPLAGVLIKERAEHFYDSAQINPTLNLVRAVTAGFDEPWALSLFLGRVVAFDEKEGTHKSKNKGYSGLTISVGDRHIRQNELVEDNWIETEWKVKGDRDFATHKLSWSYRIGLKLHENADIQDTYYLSVRRSKLDFESDWRDWINNSGIEYTVDFSTADNRPLRHFLLVDKKFPVTFAKAGLSLGVGLLWDSSARYKGALREDLPTQTTVIFRPNLQF